MPQRFRLVTWTMSVDNQLSQNHTHSGPHSLDQLERGFRDRLAKELRACVDGNRELLFLTQDFRPNDWPLDSMSRARTRSDSTR